MKSLILFLTLNPLQLQGDTPILSSLLLQPSGYHYLCVFSRVSLCNSIWQYFCLSFPEPRDDKGCFSSGLLCLLSPLPFVFFNFYFPPSIKKKKILVMRR